MRNIVLSIALVVLTVLPVFADGECPERPATPQEKAAFRSVYEAAKAALPPAPKDWVIKDETESNSSPALRICAGHPDDKPQPYRMKFLYSYSDEVSSRSDMKINNDAMKGTPDQQAKLAELDRKIKELQNARREARRNHDPAEKERIRDEIKALKWERDKVNDEINEAYAQRVQSGALGKEIEKNKPARRTAELTITANERSAWVSPSQTTPVQVSGASQAYWSKGENNGGRLVIMLGPWDASKFTALFTKTSLITRAQTMLIEVSGEQQMAESLARQIKFDLLKRELSTK